MSGSLRERLELRASQLGFARLGVAEVAPLGRDAETLTRWLAAGHHASMQWMADTEAVRRDPSHPRMLQDATRVVVLATPYARAGARSGPGAAVVARYARGRDYHNVVGKRMRVLAKIIREEGHRVRAGTDSLPVMERAWAQRAGVGFIGKNCCLIIPGLGSHVFLSVLVTDAPLPPDEPAKERCGACRLCLDACPTGAFVRSRELDSRRCISYLTIEHRGAIDAPLRADLGAHLFGCDDCQDVCPFNRGALPSEDATEPFARDDRLDVELEALLSMTEEQHAEWARGSPLRRARRAGLARNAALVLGNTGDRRHLPVLREAESHDDETVADAAHWARLQIEAREG